MMTVSPRVSVLMPVHNGMPFLPEAVNSILNQSYRDFEFIIVNDCSVDGTTQYLDSLTDPRVVQIHLAKNQGVTGALRAGLRAVRGEYVVRLDADDIAYPYRLARQVSFMDSDASVGLLASNADIVDELGVSVSKGTNRIKSEIDLRWELLFKNPIIHSTVLLRRNILTTYSLNYERRYAEDYDLWVEMAKVTRIAVLPSRLIQYRINSRSWTYSKSNEQVQASLEVSKKAMQNLVKLSNESVGRIRQSVRSGARLSGKDIDAFMNLVEVFLDKHNHMRSITFDRRIMALIRLIVGWQMLGYGLFWRLFHRCYFW
ncbi:MAG: glycosyltransferase family 2 protein [Cyclobacteriaceae bacterium]|nr:glycosyltransferase family 2 protein [Cyclobacteriaceae bacterium]